MDHESWQAIQETFLFTHTYMYLDLDPTAQIGRLRCKKSGAIYHCGCVSAYSKYATNPQRKIIHEVGDAGDGTVWR